MSDGNQQDDDYIEFRLTDEEFVTVLDALRYARQEAVHGDAQTKFRQAESQFIQQSDHHADGKRTTSDRFSDEGDE